MKAKILFFVLILTSAASLRGQVPDSPVLSEPPDLGMVSAFSVELEWNSVSTALWYIVEVNTDPYFGGVSIVHVTSYSTHFVVPSGVLSPNTTYYWRVRACNLSGAGAWSTIRSFMTAGNALQELFVLRNHINSLVTNGLITSSNAEWLNSKIDHAIEKLQHGNIRAAEKSINSFENRVNSLVRQRELNAQTGQELIGMGDYIMAIIRNGGDSPVLENTPIKDYALSQNYPNPFNPSTLITYSIPRTEQVVLKIYDITGSEVVTLVNEVQNARKYSIRWNANEFSSGVYIYTLNAGSYKESKLMLLIR